jgi:hypothetical protein
MKGILPIITRVYFMMIGSGNNAELISVAHVTHASDQGTELLFNLNIP